jgi:hypothetical protein
MAVSASKKLFNSVLPVCGGLAVVYRFVTAWLNQHFLLFYDEN